MYPTKQNTQVVALSNEPRTTLVKLPVNIGLLAGMIASLAIVTIIATIAPGAGQDLWTSPRIIASVLLGGDAATGIFPIALGTAMHFASGAMYGALFALIVPRLPVAGWMVAGLLYGVLIWGIAVAALPLLVNTLDVDTQVYFSGLLISHVVFGFVVGMAGSVYSLMQHSE